MIYSKNKNINYGNGISVLSPPILDPYDSDNIDDDDW